MSTEFIRLDKKMKEIAQSINPMKQAALAQSLIIDLVSIVEAMNDRITELEAANES